jgi:hypothetical protein
MNNNQHTHRAKDANNPSKAPIQMDSMDLFAEELPEHSDHFTYSTFSSIGTAACTCAWSTFGTFATKVSP